jgi:trehalose 6-phosphate phosphatase
MIAGTYGAEPPDTKGMALFLDLDGTLAPIAATPSEVVLDCRFLDMLPRLMRRLDGRVAIISGRSLENVDSILRGSVTAVAGVHGLERRTASGARIGVAAHPKLADARQEFLRLSDVYPGSLVEDKGLGVALHYRGAPAAASVAREIGRRFALGMGLGLQEGDMIVELLTPGQDKGGAVSAFMREPPFAGGIPVFVGDDLTDEHAFAAAEAWGGFGIQVGPERETKARYRLRDVEAVIAWLQSLIADTTI